MGAQVALGQELMELSRELEVAKRALDDNSAAYQQLRDRVANSEMYAAQMRDQEAGMASDMVNNLREEMADMQALVRDCDPPLTLPRAQLPHSSIEGLNLEFITYQRYLHLSYNLSRLKKGSYYSNSNGLNPILMNKL